MIKETKTKRNALLEDDEEITPKKNSLEKAVEDELEEEEAEEATGAKKTPVAKPAKVAPIKENADMALMSDIKKAQKSLESEEQVKFLVPLSEGEKPGSVHECFVNGYKYTVQKGVMTTVPMSIANLLADHYKITQDVGSKYRVDLNQEKASALS